MRVDMHVDMNCIFSRFGSDGCEQIVLVMRCLLTLSCVFLALSSVFGDWRLSRRTSLPTSALIA